MGNNVVVLLRKTFLIVISMFVLIVISSCSASSKKMSQLDQKYDKLANKAAKGLLQSEVEKYTWTTVETGKLQYLYSARNADNDQIQVHYLSKFDAAGQSIDEWVEFTVLLSEELNSVMDTTVSYWNAYEYEVHFDDKNNYVGDFTWSYVENEGWFNVNLTDEQYIEVKEKFEEIYLNNNNILNAIDYMIDMLGKPYKAEYMDTSTGEYNPAEIFVLCCYPNNYHGKLLFAKDGEEKCISSVYWRSDVKEQNTFDGLVSDLTAKIGKEPKQYTLFSVGYEYGSKEILVSEFDEYVQISVQD